MNYEIAREEIRIHLTGEGAPDIELPYSRNALHFAPDRIELRFTKGKTVVHAVITGRRRLKSGALSADASHERSISWGGDYHRAVPPQWLADLAEQHRPAGW